MPGSRRVLALLVVLSVLGACAENRPPEERVPVTALSPAADLRIRLDRLFRQHVYVAARIVESALAKQAGPLQGALARFDDIGIALGKELRALYGERVEKEVVTSWRDYREQLVTSIIRFAAKKNRTDVMKGLARFADDLASVGADVAPEINEFRTARTVVAMTGVVEDMIAALVKKDASKAYALARTASNDAGVVSDIFAIGIADDRPRDFPGLIDAPAVVFRHGLSALLRDHLSLVSLATEDSLTKRAAGAKGAGAGAAAALDQAAAFLAGTYGEAYRAPFTAAWKRQGDLALAYAAAGKDKAKRAQAGASLKQLASDLTGFFADRNPLLDRHDLAGLLMMFENKVQAFIDKQIAGDFDGAGTAVDAAAAALDEVAGALAQATARRFPTRFLPRRRTG